jgi:peptide/nickel transport system substrate-binding protein
MNKLHAMAAVAIIAASLGSTIVLSVGGLGAGFTNAYGQPSTPSVAEVDSNPNGASYEEWSMRYWKWILAIPSDMNPIFSDNQENCDENQTEESVWFLLGPGPDNDGNVYQCAVPEGRSLFMPMLSNYCAEAVTGPLNTDEALAECREPMDSVTELKVEIDGTMVEGLEDNRVTTDFFEVQLPELNLFAGDSTEQMISDGYWMMIEPLPAGNHEIHIRAVQQDDSTVEDQVNPSTPVITEFAYCVNVGGDSPPENCAIKSLGTTTINPATGIEQDLEGEADLEDEGEAMEEGESPVAEQQQQPSGCLIATAAFGSELTPQVQYLRNFRESYILSTTTGSAFMNTFNSVYYSFSPQVADYEREQPWLQQTVKTAIYPLFGILGVTEKAFWAANGGELGSVVAGATASLMIGAVYVSPIVATAKPLQRRISLNKKTIIILASIVAAALAVLGIATATGAFLEFATAGFVIVMTAVSGLMASKLWWKLARQIKGSRK